MENLVRRSNPIINDWDLEAIIRGSWGGGGSASSMAVEEVAATWQPLGLGLFEGFDESVEQLEATATVLNELEELYKPFLLQQPTSTTSDSPAAGPTTTASSLSSPAIFNGGDDGVDKPEVMRPGVADDHTPARASCKPVRGRNRNRKQKTQVVQLGVGDDDENLRNMDEWNWRKYGQKSIKGSPYPRSYYRCSSSVGCGARKQVEQSMNHPYTYIVTYIGDHAHPLPARRRSVTGRKLAYVSSSDTALTAFSNIII